MNHTGRKQKTGLTLMNSYKYTRFPGFSIKILMNKCTRFLHKNTSGTEKRTEIYLKCQIEDSLWKRRTK